MDVVWTLVHTSMPPFHCLQKCAMLQSAGKHAAYIKKWEAMSWSGRVVSSLTGFRKLWISVGLCTLALCAGLWGFAALSSLKKQPPQRETVAKRFNVEVFDVDCTNMQETVVGYGTARSDREVILSAQIGGEVVEEHPRLKVGEAVQAAGVAQDSAGRSQPFAGDVLVKIDPEQYRQKLLQAESRLNEDEADRRLLEQQEQNTARHLDRAREDFRLYEEEVARIEALRKQKIKADSDLTAARLELQRYKESLVTLENERKLFPIRHEQLDRKVAAHQSEVNLLSRDLEHTVVRPPFSGILSEVMVELGQHVRPGDALVKLIDVSVVEIPISLPLGDYAKVAGKLARGEKPRADLAENETAPARWTGHVVRVAPQADQLTRTVKAFVQVENSQQAVPLLPGTFVYARIEGPLLKQVFVVPRDCIVNGKVFLASQGRAEVREVEIGETLHAFAVISQGLRTSDQVVMTNLDILYDSANVRIQAHRNLKQELRHRNPWGQESLAKTTIERSGTP